MPDHRNGTSPDGRAWPFQEARSLLQRLESGDASAEKLVVFETGYGPSGLPHMGTFAEVSRTTMVRHAFGNLSGLPSKLICFSDDMDGMRAIPENVPNHELLRPFLGRPLTEVPDPFEEYESFGHANNAKLKAFLDRFGFEYEFLSATDCYRSGRFDDALLAVLGNYQRIKDVILPTLGPERRETYSPFLPICPKTGVVLQVPLLEHNSKEGTITFKDTEGDVQTVPVTQGNAKLQWKVDWAMRWHALGVDYEMAGKDLIESVKLSSKVLRILGGVPPAGFSYEMFLDENGEKISKSRGNGLTIDEWLEYAPEESLSLFMFQSPRRAKRLHFDVIPRAVDDYYTLLQAYARQDPRERVDNPVYHIHSGQPPSRWPPISYSILLNLTTVAHARDSDSLRRFASKYHDAAEDDGAALDRLIDFALCYYRDFVKPNLRYRAPTPLERTAFAELASRLKALAEDAEPEEIQQEVYAVGKQYDFKPLRDWFCALYECLLGQSEGPRFGGFVAIYGVRNTVRLLESCLSTESTMPPSADLSA